MTKHITSLSIGRQDFNAMDVQDMLNKFALQRKGGLTLGPSASVRQRTVHADSMANESCAIGVSFRTKITFVWAVSCMLAHVALEMGRTAEARIAIAAEMGPLVGMNEHVTHKRLACGETLAAARPMACIFAFTLV